MKKMMFLTLALSVITMGSVMAMDSSAAEARRPGRVDVDIHVVGGAYNPYVGLVHAIFCPECRIHRGGGHHHDCCHKPHPPKRDHDMHHGGRKPHPEYRHGGGRDNHKPHHGRPGGRGDRRDDNRGRGGNHGAGRR